MDFLDVAQRVEVDNRIVKIDEHIFKPYNIVAINESDEIRIALQNENLLTLPSESFLYLEGTFTPTTDTAPLAKLTNNCLAFLFEEIRFDLNGKTIDRTRNVGMTSLLKNLVSLNQLKSDRYKTAGWVCPGEDVDILTTNKFNACIPPSFFFIPN